MKRARVFIVAALALVLAGWAVLDGYDRPPAPEGSLTAGELEQVYAALLTRVTPGGPNLLHSRRLFYYAPPFAQAEGANLSLVQAAALLHDSMKERGAGEPRERFCSHGEQAADLTHLELLRLGKSEAFAAHAAAAVREHMGPCGFNWHFFSDRFMSKFCDHAIGRLLCVHD